MSNINDQIEATNLSYKKTITTTAVAGAIGLA